MQKPKKRTRRQTAPSPPEESALGLRSVEALAAMLGGTQQDDAVDAAQDLMYDAWEASDRRRRIALAKKALKTSPLCADAYVLLAWRGRVGRLELVPCIAGISAKRRSREISCGAVAGNERQ